MLLQQTKSINFVKGMNDTKFKIFYHLSVLLLSFGFSKVFVNNNRELLEKSSPNTSGTRVLIASFNSRPFGCAEWQA